MALFNKINPLPGGGVVPTDVSDTVLPAGPFGEIATPTVGRRSVLLRWTCRDYLLHGATWFSHE